MDARTLEFCRSLRRIADLIESSADLSSCAAESTAFVHFKDAVAEVDRVIDDHHALPMLLKELGAQHLFLKKQVQRSLRAIEATRVLLPHDCLGLPPLEMPALDMDTMIFTAKALAWVEAEAHYGAAFITAGLHPRTFASVLEDLAALEDVNQRIHSAKAQFEACADCLTIALDTARKRRHQLFHALDSALTPDRRVQLRHASSLGRRHRPNALRAPEALKLLPRGAPSVEPTPESVNLQVGFAEPQSDPVTPHEGHIGSESERRVSEAETAASDTRATTRTLPGTTPTTSVASRARHAVRRLVGGRD